MVINCRIQTVMKMLMEKLGIEIPEYTFDRGVDIWVDKDKKLRAQGITRNGTLYENYKKMTCNYQEGANAQVVNLEFFGHYHEKKLEIKVPTKLLEGNEKVKLIMVCDP